LTPAVVGDGILEVPQDMREGFSLNGSLKNQNAAKPIALETEVV
jgi:hypothetical protein